MALRSLARRAPAPRRDVVVPDRIEESDSPYVRPAHMAPPSGPSLHVSIAGAVTWNRIPVPTPAT